ncbi:MAG: hypothetical protein JNL51_04545 [Chitinophagaceae bacterium]|nr:hypothetical protein [Chitinophagaceae bacterium]
MVIAILAEEAFRKKIASSLALSAEEQAASQAATRESGQMQKKKKEPPIPQATIVWADSLRSLTIIDADVYIDLLFDADRERISRLESLAPKPILVYTTNNAIDREINPCFMRILEIRVLKKGGRIAAAGDKEQEKTVGRAFDALGWDCRFVKEKTPGEKASEGRVYVLPSAKKPKRSNKRSSN